MERCGEARAEQLPGKPLDAVKVRVAIAGSKGAPRTRTRNVYGVKRYTTSRVAFLAFAAAFAREFSTLRELNDDHRLSHARVV